MSLWSGLKNFFFKPKQRNYASVTSIGGVNSDWALSSISQDADVWQNNPAYRQRVRELFDTDPILKKYREQYVANVYGDEGIQCRLKVKEKADRTVYVDEEKTLHLERKQRLERITQWAEKRHGVRPAFRIGFECYSEEINRAKGKIKAGALDIYANQLIEAAWKDWQRAEYATVTGKITYGESRHQRGIAVARDGDFFIRLIRNPAKSAENPLNKYGFSLQLINSEWCDFNFNRPKSDGQNEIRMGVELNEWGKPIAYHFIKRSAADWQFSAPALGLFTAKMEHERIEAQDVIHYARFDYADSTRPASWCVAAIPNARALMKYVEAALIAARAGACQSGFLVSKINPEGGAMDPSLIPNPCELVGDIPTVPGMVKALPAGVEFVPNNPDNPNSEFSQFRKEAVRQIAASLPGGNYNSLANDSEGISYSTGRIFSLEEREIWKGLQRFDIDKAERPIFEAWLEMALITGAIPLPLAKYEKFNKAVFTGRRWPWVDPSKDATALETELKNLLTSWSRVFDEKGWDLEEVWIERAEEMMLAEQLGLTLPTWDAAPPQEAEDDEEETPPPGNGSAKKKKNGREVSLTVN